MKPYEEELEVNLQRLNSFAESVGYRGNNFAVFTLVIALFRKLSVEYSSQFHTLTNWDDRCLFAMEKLGNEIDLLKRYLKSEYFSFNPIQEPIWEDSFFDPVVGPDPKSWVADWQWTIREFWVSSQSYEYTPLELVDLLVELSVQDNDQKFWDPACGAGGLGKDSSFHFFNHNSLHENPPEVDLVLSNPPFSIKANPDDSENKFGFKMADWWFVQKAIEAT